MKTAIVTGGTGALGRVVASVLLNNGIRVAIPLRPGYRGEPLLPPGEGDRLFRRESDITVEEGASAFVRETAEKFGEPEILVNCAGGYAGGRRSAKSRPPRLKKCSPRT